MLVIKHEKFVFVGENIPQSVLCIICLKITKSFNFDFVQFFGNIFQVILFCNKLNVCDVMKK